MPLSRDDQSPALFDPALYQVRFMMLDGSKRVLGYVSVEGLTNAAKREQPGATYAPPMELFDRYRDRIEKAASAQYDEGHARMIEVREPTPFVWVAAF